MRNDLDKQHEPEASNAETEAISLNLSSKTCAENTAARQRPSAN